MAVSVTADALVASAQRRAFMPASGQGLSAADFLSILNEELQGYLVPLILECAQGHFDATADVSLVAGQADYLLPTRAAGSLLEFAVLLDASGNLILPALQPLTLQEAAVWPLIQSTGVSQNYALKGNNIRLVPTPSAPLAATTLRVTFPQRPSQLVLLAGAIVTTGFPAGAAAGNFRVSYSGSPPSGFIVGASVELVRASSGFEVYGPFPVAASAAGSFDLTGTLPTAIGAGDYLCLRDTAPVVTGVPQELVWPLVQKVAVTALSIRGDDSKIERATAELQRLEAMARHYLGQRDRGASHKMLNGQNRFGTKRAPFYPR